MTAPCLTDTEIAAEIRKMSVDSKIKVTWYEKSKPGVVKRYTGVVKSKPTDVSATVTYEEDANHTYGLPPASSIAISKIHIVETSVVITEYSAQPASAHINSIDIVPWLAETWGALINHSDQVVGRTLLLNELKEYFLLWPRHFLTDRHTSVDHERTTLLEVITGWVILAQSVVEWNTGLFLGIVRPALLRLAELVKGEGKSGKDRTVAMNSVRNATLKLTYRNDPLTAVMLGATIPKPDG
jgi:hypothetical protein